MGRTPRPGRPPRSRSSSTRTRSTITSARWSAGSESSPRLDVVNRETRGDLGTDRDRRAAARRVPCALTEHRDLPGCVRAESRPVVPVGAWRCLAPDQLEPERLQLVIAVELDGQAPAFLEAGEDDLRPERVAELLL